MTAITPSIQYAWDGPGTLGAGQNGQALLWDNATGKFVAGSAGVTAHSGLTGLTTGDDHTQYLLVNGTRAMTGNLVMGAGLQVRSDYVYASDGGQQIQLTSGLLKFWKRTDHVGRADFGAGADINILGGELSITEDVATSVPLIVKGAASQSADLQQWQNSAGTVLANVSAAGVLTLPAGSVSSPALMVSDGGGLYRGATGYLNFSTAGTRRMQLYSALNLFVPIIPETAATVPLTVKGAASQTADLQQWQNSAGTVLSSIKPSGAFSDPATATEAHRLGSVLIGVSYFGATNHITAVANGGALNLSRIDWTSANTVVNANSRLNCYPQQADRVPLAVRAATSQTEDLVIITDNTPTILSRFSKAGYFMTRKTASPADGDLATGELAFWLDATPGAARAMFKAKDSAGTVVSGSVALA